MSVKWSSGPIAAPARIDVVAGGTPYLSDITTVILRGVICVS